MSGSVHMMDDYRNRSIGIKEAAGLTDEELKEKIVVGELVDIEKPEMLEEIERMKARAMKGPG
jgi:2-oxoglutarate ferredoxin oxidoreductase subunit beta